MRSSGIPAHLLRKRVLGATVGAAIAMKKGVKTAAEAATAIGEGLQAFCIDSSVADDPRSASATGNLGAMLLSEESVLPLEPRVLCGR